MKALHGLLIVVGVALVGGLLYLGSSRSRPREGFFSGVVETTLWDLAFEVAGRIDSFAVDEGHLVAAGAPWPVFARLISDGPGGGPAWEGRPPNWRPWRPAAAREIRSAQARLDRAGA